MKRNRLWLYIGIYIAVSLIVGTWSSVGATVLFVVGAGIGVRLILKNRPAIGQFGVSTTCEHCGALLQEHAGMPEAVLLVWVSPVLGAAVSMTG